VKQEEGGTGLRDAESVRREAEMQLRAARSLAPRVAAVKLDLERLRQTNHFREGFVEMLREQGHHG
jgi:hypothetical protein